MILDISAAALQPGTEFSFDLSEALPPEAWNGDEVTYTVPVHFQGHYVVAGDQVLVYGRVTARLSAPCADCLEPADISIAAKAEARFASEADPDDPELWEYSGHTVELTDVIRGAVFSHMPMRILCREDCAGLCQQCGVNRNHVSCSCQKEMPSAHPFSALASLLIQDEEV